MITEHHIYMQKKSGPQNRLMENYFYFIKFTLNA